MGDLAHECRRFVVHLDLVQAWDRSWSHRCTTHAAVVFHELTVLALPGHEARTVIVTVSLIDDAMLRLPCSFEVITNSFQAVAACLFKTHDVLLDDLSS